MTAYVYLPDDETDSQMVDGLDYVLLPNAATPIKSRSPKLSDVAVAKHIEAKLGLWGVRVVSGPVTNGVAQNPADQAVVDEAERVYLEATKKWAEGLLLDRAKRNGPRVAIGLPVDKPSKEEETAEAWLSAKADKLSAL
jgi:hypothetical protein